MAMDNQRDDSSVDPCRLHRVFARQASAATPAALAADGSSHDRARPNAHGLADDPERNSPGTGESGVTEQAQTGPYTAPGVAEAADGTPTEAALPEERPPQKKESKTPPADTTTVPQSAESRPHNTLLLPYPALRHRIPQMHCRLGKTWWLTYLQKEKRYPAQSRWRHEEGVVYVRFSLDRNGRVLKAEVAHSSGYAALDAEVLDLLQRAQPLPKPPDDVPGDPIELMVPVNFFMRKH